jgi:hypothetical protein
MFVARFVVFLAVLVLALAGCAATRADSYNPTICYELKREARRAGSWRVGSSAVAAGLAAGGAVVPLVGDSKPAQVGLALGAVLFGAAGLAAGYTADDAQKEWVDHCPYIPVDQQIPDGSLAGALLAK